MNKVVVVLLLLFSNLIEGAFAMGAELYDKFPNAISYYYGWTTDNTLLETFSLKLDRYPEHIQSIEATHTLNPDNGIRRFFSPVVGVVQIAANLSVRQGSLQPTIYEFDPYIAFRWANLPWNNIINTSFAVGEGISYASKIPPVEQDNPDLDTKKLLNYLMFEVTFAHPDYARLQGFVRLHHRSGAFGVYSNDSVGSTAAGFGVRYLFG